MGRLPPERMYPAGEPGVTVRFVTIENGLSLRVLESGPPKDDAVVLVHGWGGCVYTFAEMIPALVSAGHRVIALDLPGHGLSDKPADESKYTSRALSDAILDVATAMRLRRFTYVGHSMGGSLGLHLATRGERMMSALVLINSVGLGRIPVLPAVKLLSPSPVNRLVPRLLARTTISMVLKVAFGTKARPTERDIDEYWAPTQFPEFAWACRACVHRVTWTRLPASKLRSLRLPVLVITGGRDRLVYGSDKRARLVPTARIVSIPDGGHLVLQECAPRSNGELLQFLRTART